MVKMIIADDEFIVRDGLKNIVPWEDFGIEVIAEAIDGQEAYELCQQLHPDILFTDIRMPLMDGLEVALKLKEQGSDIKIIIISGIQDFNYAKTALDINAEGYILKPIKISELKEVVLKVSNKINMERNTEYRIQKLKQQLRENLSNTRDKFLRNLISGCQVKERDMKEKLDYFQLPIVLNESLMVSVLQIDDYSKSTQDYPEEDKQLLSFSVNNIMAEIIDNFNAGIVFYTSENEFVIFFNPKAQSNDKYIEICEELLYCLKKFLNLSVSIGIGRPVNNILHARVSYLDALTALQYRFYVGKNSILNITDIQYVSQMTPGIENLKYTSMFEAENQLINAMRLGDSHKVDLLLNEIFNTFLTSQKPSSEYVQSVCVELVCIASRAVFELGESIDSIAGNRTIILDTIYSTESIFDLKDYLRSVFTKISGYFAKKYGQKNCKIIHRIKSIIHQKYTQDISVAKISQEVYLTPNYISLIFKQETGETITEYITKVRMEAAKELLKTTDFKVLEIAEMVGFDNPQYFSTVFKKSTGVHPGKYRSSESD